MNMIMESNSITYYNKKIYILISIIFLLTIIFFLNIETIFAENIQYIKVDDMYSDALNLLSIDVTLKEPHLVGHVRILINDGTEKDIKFIGNNKYRWNRIGLDLGNTNITIKVYDFDNFLLEEQNYLLDETGKLITDKFAEFASLREEYPDKIWTVEFNKSPDTITINDKNIYVRDSKGDKVQINIEQEDRKVTIKPIENYKVGETYTLYVSKNITYNGSKLKTPYKQQFRIIN